VQFLFPEGALQIAKGVSKIELLKIFFDFFDFYLKSAKNRKKIFKHLFSKLLFLFVGHPQSIKTAQKFFALELRSSRKSKS
jgi:hypothetical protein